MVHEVRPLREEEYDTYFNMTAQAFRATGARARRNRKWTKPSELRGLFVDGKLQTGLKVIDIPMWFGETPLGNGALTGVASPPENRRKGGIGRLLHATLVELKEKGVPVSTLYPFSSPFYKRYGWEHVEDKVHYKIPIDRLPFSKDGGSWQPLTRSTDFDRSDPPPVSDEDLSLLMEIYDRWTVGRVGPFVRDADWWRRGKLQEGSETPPDVYLWRDQSGAPRAYIIYAFETLENQWSRRISVWDSSALDAAALRAVMGFLRNHDSQAKEVYWTLGRDTPLFPLIEDPDFTTEIWPGVMLRLVDVTNALSVRRYPATVTARLSLAVSDPFCDWNNGTYELEVRGGAGRAEQTSGEPGLRMDQRALAQLFTGYLTARQAAALGLIEVLDPSALDAAQAIFAGPPPFLPDHF